MTKISTEFWSNVDVPVHTAEMLRTFYDGDVVAEQRAEALAPLFVSTHVVVRGIALDAYSELLPNARYGRDSLIERLESSARPCALRELRADAFERADLVVRRGANHGSAFRAMWAFVVRDDAPILAKALSENEHPAVLRAGLGAASGAMFEVERVNDRLRDVVLTLANDEAVRLDVRVDAVRAAGGSRDPVFEPAFTALLHDASLEVRSAVARALLKRDRERFRAVVAPLLALWPNDDTAPYDLVEARRLLDDDDDDWA